MPTPLMTSWMSKCWTQIAQLIAATQDRAVTSQPRDAVGKAYSRPEVVEIAIVDHDIRIGGARTDEEELHVLSVISMYEPVIEAQTRATKQCVSAASDRHGHAVLVPRNAIVVPAQTEVQRQVVGYLPVVLEEEVQFPLLEVANLYELAVERIVPACAGLFGLVDETALFDPAHGTAQEVQQIRHMVAVVGHQTATQFGVSRTERSSEAERGGRRQGGRAEEGGR